MSDDPSRPIVIKGQPADWGWLRFWLSLVYAAACLFPILAGIYANEPLAQSILICPTIAGAIVLTGVALVVWQARRALSVTLDAQGALVHGRKAPVPWSAIEGFRDGQAGSVLLVAKQGSRAGPVLVPTRTEVERTDVLAFLVARGVPRLE